MSLSHVHPRKMPVWVKLWGVPMEFLHEEGVGYAVSALGKPLQMDIVTTTNSRVCCVRASVEMEADGDFLNEFDMECADGSVCRVDVEYHILPPRCSKCCVFGHGDSECPERVTLDGSGDSRLCDSIKSHEVAAGVKDMEERS